MAEIVLAQRAVKDLEKLDSATCKRILRKLQELSADPLRNAKKLTDPKIGTFRYRIGDYRVIFDLEYEVVVVLRIGDRKNVYS